MIEMPDTEQLTVLRDHLSACGYDTAGIGRKLGSTRPPRPGEEQEMLYRTRDRTPENALLRLFLIGASLDADMARELLPGPFFDTCRDLALIEVSEDRVRANVVIVPVDDLLFASDAFHVLGGDKAAEFVLPASTHSALFLKRLTLREPVASCLDLGCGCGIQALFAARHSGSVVATDVSAAAVRYTAFNAVLNGIDNVECLRGSLFGPVEGRRFDLIVSNPPFVIGPGEDYVYRDNRLELDDFCRQLIAEAPAYLTGAGRLQMLAEWVEIRGEAWDERLRQWVADSGCDTWILKSPPRRPAEYVAGRATDIAGPLASPGRGFGDWARYFEERDVTGIHPGMILLKRRDAGDDDNWFEVFGLTGDVAGDAGQTVARHVEACDFLDAVADDASLEAATLEIAPTLELEQRLHRGSDGWEPRRLALTTADAIPNEAEVDFPVMSFVDQVDGKRTVGETLDDFCAKTGADRGQLGAELLEVIRLFVARGYLEPVNFDA